MKRYCKNSKPYIYVAFPVDKKEEVLNILEILNKENIEFWYPDNFNKNEIKRINASFNVLAFVTKEYAKSDEFRSIIDNAVSFNKNILCVYLEDVEETPWMKMQLSSQQSLRTDNFDEVFTDKLKASFIFKDMKVTPIQKKLQRNKAIAFVTVPIVLALALFLGIVRPLLASKQEKTDLVEHWGVKEDDLEKITELYIIGDHSFNSGVRGEYTDQTKTKINFWLDLKAHDSKDYVGVLPVGTLTSKDLEIVKYMPNLRVLSVVGEQITDISPLFGTNIGRLNLSCNPISSIEGIEQIPNLTELTLSNTDIVDIEPIRGLKNLNYLYLRNSNVSNIDAVEDLTNLILLDIENTKVKEITKMPKLGEDVMFSFQAMNVTLTDVSGLSNISRFRQVGLSNQRRSLDFDKKLGDALSNSVVSLLNYDGCVTVEPISSIHFDDYSDVELSLSNLTSLDGIENAQGIYYLDLSRSTVGMDAPIDLTALLKLESLNTLTLPRSLQGIAKEQLKDAQFHIDYK